MTVTDPDIAQLTEKKHITQQWISSQKSRNQETERGFTWKKKTDGTGSNCTPSLLKCHTHRHTCAWEYGVWKSEEI